MTTASFVITVISLALTAAMAVALALLLHDNRRRSAARVAALVRMAEGPLWAEEEQMSPLPEQNLTPTQPWLPRAAQLAMAGVLALILLSAIGVTMLNARSHAGSVDGRTAQAPAPEAPVELLALRYTQERDGLTVTGRVQKPAGVPATNLIATVFLFGTDGSFINSGRVPIDARALADGKAASFDVSIQAAVPVARYRVSFRDDTGQTIAHVDKRNGARVAQMSDRQP